MNVSLCNYFLNKIAYSVRDSVKRDKKVSEETSLYTNSCCAAALCRNDLSTLSTEELSNYFDESIAEEVSSWYKEGCPEIPTIQEQPTSIYNCILSLYAISRCVEDFTNYSSLLLYQCATIAYIMEEDVDSMCLAEELIIPDHKPSVQRVLMRNLIDVVNRKRESVKNPEYLKKEVERIKSVLLCISSKGNYYINELHTLLCLAYSQEMNEILSNNKNLKKKGVEELSNSILNVLSPKNTCMITSSISVILLCKDVVTLFFSEPIVKRKDCPCVLVTHTLDDGYKVAIFLI